MKVSSPNEGKTMVYERKCEQKTEMTSFLLPLKQKGKETEAVGEEKGRGGQYI